MSCYYRHTSQSRELLWTWWSRLKWQVTRSAHQSKALSICFFMAPPQQQPYVRAGEHLNEFLPNFWQRQIDAAEQETSDYRHPILPLARIKKVMKSDPDVKVWKSSSCTLAYFWLFFFVQMIAADGADRVVAYIELWANSLNLIAPILFCKACESKQRSRWIV